MVLRRRRAGQDGDRLAVTEPPALFLWDVSAALGPSYIKLVNDLVSLLVVQLVVQALLSAASDDVSLFDPSFWVVLFFMALGVLTYHLGVKRLVAVV